MAQQVWPSQSYCFVYQPLEHNPYQSFTPFSEGTKHSHAERDHKLSSYPEVDL